MIYFFWRCPHVSQYGIRICCVQRNELFPRRRKAVYFTARAERHGQKSRKAHRQPDFRPLLFPDSADQLRQGIHQLHRTNHGCGIPVFPILKPNRTSAHWLAVHRRKQHLCVFFAAVLHDGIRPFLSRHSRIYDRGEHGYIAGCAQCRNSGHCSGKL